MKKQEKLNRRNITSNDRVDKIVERVCKEYGLGRRGYSAALRLIVLDWENARAGRVDAGQERISIIE